MKSHFHTYREQSFRNTMKRCGHNVAMHTRHFVVNSLIYAYLPRGLESTKDGRHAEWLLTVQIYAAIRRSLAFPVELRNPPEPFGGQFDFVAASLPRQLAAKQVAVKLASAGILRTGSGQFPFRFRRGGAPSAGVVILQSPKPKVAISTTPTASSTEEGSISIAAPSPTLHRFETKSPKAGSSRYLFSQVVYMMPTAPWVRSRDSIHPFGFSRSSAS